MSTTVRNLYKLSVKHKDVYNTIFEAKKKYNLMLIGKTGLTVREKLPEIIKCYDKKEMFYPTEDYQWINLAYRLLRYEVDDSLRQIHRIENAYDFFDKEKYDYNVTLVMYHHKTGYYVQLFGSEWAINELKLLLNLTEDYSYDNRSDYPGAKEQEETVKTLINDIFSGAGVPSECGLPIIICDSVPFYKGDKGFI